MAVDVSSVARMLNGFKNKEENLSLNLMTKDFLTVSSSSSSDSIPVLDLDLQVPSGWEKTLDLKSGRVYLKKRSSPSSSSSSSSSSSDHRDKKNEEEKKKVRGLKFPVLEDGLELKLLPTAASSYRNQSVCTLDKVKSALEREKSKSKSPSPDSESISSSSSKLFAGGCPGCLLYVLISKENPNCPHCASIVPSPGSSSSNKKPRIDLDLNLSL